MYESPAYTSVEILLLPGANVIKLFTAISYEFLYQARAFVPGKLFQSSLMFAG
jgi:hypothetical protein